MAKTNLQQRIITGIIGVAALLFLIIFNEYTFLFLTVGLSIGSLYEFYGLAERHTGSKPNKFWGYFFTFASIQIVYWVEKQILPVSCYFLFFPLFSIVFIAELYQKHSAPFQNIAYSILGILYTVIPFLFFIKISFLGNHVYDWHLVLGIFIILWVSDTGAYISGKSFGKNKLFPSVSPGKTWEGTIGGALLSIAIAYAISCYWLAISQIEWFGIACIIIVFGMYGDLVESKFKRSIQIKDSGTLLPGHGGMLDRFDGLYLSLPVIYSFLVFFH